MSFSLRSFSLRKVVTYWAVAASISGITVFSIYSLFFEETSVSRVDQPEQTSKMAKKTPMTLIAAGEFLMGSNVGRSNERPAHMVHIDAFRIDAYEVTNAKYREFAEATGHSSPFFMNDMRFNAPNQPVVGVTWFDAVSYAQWAGKRLPTEAEWEKAARGGLEGKYYPWGNSVDKSRATYEGNYPTPVGTYAPNGFGLYDMSGNVEEWCMDGYSEEFYSRSLRDNPIAGGFVSFDDFMKVTTARVLRGGNWRSRQNGIRVSDRCSDPPSRRYYGIGFRCVNDNKP